MTVLRDIRDHAVLPVVVIEDADRALDLGDALAAGGLPLAEITFRTPAAASAIRALTEHRPDLLVGAGTITTVREAESAVAAGSRFLVSPGLSSDVVEYAGSVGVPIMPGVQTATEIMAATAMGVEVLKFFPAAVSGGTAALSSLAGPFPGTWFVPTGGIGPADLRTYLELPNVWACGGTWLTPPDEVADGRFDLISELAAEAVGLVRLAGR